MIKVKEDRKRDMRRNGQWEERDEGMNKRRK